MGNIGYSNEPKSFEELEDSMDEATKETKALTEDETTNNLKG